LACVEKGLDVIQQDLESGLALFENQSFDMVVLSQTLQTIHETESILNEIVRVGKECIISFPNFAHWSHRIDILLGRMPVSKSLPFDWYNTPNVRVLTIADFEALASKIGLKILDRVILHEGKEISWGANLFGSLAIYRVQSA
jgi:methionine biosynthesis protein MetW